MSPTPLVREGLSAFVKSAVTDGSVCLSLLLFYYVCEGSAPAITVLAIMGHARQVCLSLCYLIICQSVRPCEGSAPGSTGGSRTVSLSVSGIILSVYRPDIIVLVDWM